MRWSASIANRARLATLSVTRRARFAGLGSLQSSYHRLRLGERAVAIAAQYDAVVIGSGHNGLTCASYLAKSGLRVLVLEKHHTIGGMTGTEELTLPGFRSDTHAICIQFANFSPAPAELGLAEHGFELLRPDPCWSHALPDGHSLTVHRDVEATCVDLARHSGPDAATWRTLYREFLQQERAITGSFTEPPPTAIADPESDPDQYRFALQSLRSWCGERFVSEEVKALVGSWAMHIGAAPEEVGSASAAWLFSMVIQRYGNNVVRGGMGNLAAALAGVVQAHGGEIRTGAEVKRIAVEGGRAVGVELADGDHIDGFDLLAASTHPRPLVLDLLGESAVGAGVADRMRHYELGQSVLVIYLALDSPVEFRAGPTVSRSVYVHPSPPSLDYFTQLYCEARSGRLPAEPFALICNDSAADASRVPPGRALMKLVVQPVPYRITGDAGGSITSRDWAQAKEPFADRVIDLLTRRYIPDLADKIVARVVRSPVDLEQILPSAVQGTNSHGAMLPYQAGGMRPVPGMGRYRTPVANVYLCGAGAHPGPGVTMAPGRNAARVILAELGLAAP